MFTSGLAVLPLIGLSGLAYRSTQPSAWGSPPTVRQRLLLAVTVLAFGGTFLGLGSLNQGREFAMTVQLEQFAVVGSLSLIPLGVFLAFDIPLRLVRRWEVGASRRCRHAPDLMRMP